MLDLYVQYPNALNSFVTNFLGKTRTTVLFVVQSFWLNSTLKFLFFTRSRKGEKVRVIIRLILFKSLLFLATWREVFPIFLSLGIL